MGHSRRMIVTVSGATGGGCVAKLRQVLKSLSVESRLVATQPGEMTPVDETDFSPKTLKAMADVVYASGDSGPAISPGCLCGRTPFAKRS